MHIRIVTRENYAILHLRGGFDTSDVPMLQQEIDALTKANITRVILNLRLVRFINTTALGAMIKFNQLLQAKNGKLVISHPSKFCHDIIKKVGLDHSVTVFKSDEAAAASFAETKAEEARRARSGVPGRHVLESCSCPPTKRTSRISSPGKSAT